MTELFKPKSIQYLGNCFAEICPAAGETPDALAYQMIETALTVIADRCYPQTGWGVETAHIVVMDHPDGFKDSAILIEFELDDGIEPSPALVAAMEGLQALAGEGVHYVIFGGNSEPEIASFNDRWCVGVRIPLNMAMREGHNLTQRHADRLGPLLY